MFKKLVIFFIIFIFFINFSIAETSFTMFGFDGENSNRNWKKNQFFIRMEEKTGVVFELNQYNNYEDWQTFKNNLFSSNELPDILFKASLTKTEQLELFKAGKLLNIEPLLKEHAPFFYKLMNENNYIKESITLPNGEIVSLPTIHPHPTQNIMWINKNWLEYLNLKPPTNTEELKKVLLEFKNKDPNKNNKSDEIPLTFNGIWDLKFLSHGFGFISNEFNLYFDNNNIKYSILHEKYYDFINYLHDLYINDLLDKEGFYQIINLQTNNSKQDEASKYGVIIGPSPLSKVSISQSKEYIALMPLQYNNKQIYASVVDKSLSGSFAISTNCKNPAQILKWVDYLYTEEGAKLATFGEAGVDYFIFDDGTWDWADTSQQGLSNILSNSIISSSGLMPIYEPYEFQKKFDDDFAVFLMRELEKYYDYIQKPFPSFWLNQKDNAFINEIQNSLGKYIDEELSRFILGEYELTPENWDMFKSRLYNNYKLNEFLNFWENFLIKN